MRAEPKPKLNVHHCLRCLTYVDAAHVPGSVECRENRQERDRARTQ